MGINVYTKLVQHDPTHQKLVNTSLTDNPTVTTLASGLVVHNIFTRSKSQDRENDGNPLIYAMKGIKGYSIPSMFRTQLLTASHTIVTGMTLSQAPNLVMPVPSSNPFAAQVAGIVAAALGVPLAGSPLMRKRTMGEMVLAYGGTIPALNKKRAERYKQTIGLWRKANPANTFSIKDVHSSIRTCFDPLVSLGSLSHLQGQCVVLVDDLLSSGATIESAAALLQAAGAHPIGVSFLSALP